MVNCCSRCGSRGFRALVRASTLRLTWLLCLAASLAWGGEGVGSGGGWSKKEGGLRREARTGDWATGSAHLGLGLVLLLHAELSTVVLLVPLRRRKERPARQRCGQAAVAWLEALTLLRSASRTYRALLYHVCNCMTRL